MGWLEEVQQAEKLLHCVLQRGSCKQHLVLLDQGRGGEGEEWYNV